MTAARHRFTTRQPVKRAVEEIAYYGKRRGTEYHKSMPRPITWVSDCRQVAPPWTAALIDALPAFVFGQATEWKSRFKNWQDEVEHLEACKQGPNEVYERNAQFWKALYQLALQLGAKDKIITSNEVLVWAVKDTLRERAGEVGEVAEAVYDTGKAIYDVGRDAANAVSDAASAIPTIAKALAVGAVGLGVYAVAKRS